MDCDLAAVITLAAGQPDPGVMPMGGVGLMFMAATIAVGWAVEAVYRARRKK